MDDTTRKNLAERLAAQTAAADEASRRQINDTAWLSQSGKFQVSAEVDERLAQPDVLFSTFEWGETRDEVSVDAASAIELRDWLVERFPIKAEVKKRDKDTTYTILVEGKGVPRQVIITRAHVTLLHNDQWAYWTRVTFESTAERNRFVQQLVARNDMPGMELAGDKAVRLAPLYQIIKES